MTPTCQSKQSIGTRPPGSVEDSRPCQRNSRQGGPIGYQRRQNGNMPAGRVARLGSVTVMTKPVCPALLGTATIRAGRHTPSVGNGRTPGGSTTCTGTSWSGARSCYGSDYYSKSPTVDPPGPSRGSNRVSRGGSWNSPARYCRSASRCGRWPDFRFGFQGFRVAAVPSSQPGAQP